MCLSQHSLAGARGTAVIWNTRAVPVSQLRLRGHCAPSAEMWELDTKRKPKEHWDTDSSSYPHVFETSDTLVLESPQWDTSEQRGNTIPATSNHRPWSRAGISWSNSAPPFCLLEPHTNHSTTTAHCLSAAVLREMMGRFWKHRLPTDRHLKAWNPQWT